MENEIWKDVIGYEDLYQVSNMGRVRSKERVIRAKNGFTRRLPSVVLRPALQKYLRVALSKDGVETSYLVHRLVAEAFLGAIPEDMEVDHINENREDNRSDNLRFLSRPNNASRSTRGRFNKGSNSMEHNPRSKTVIGYQDGMVKEVFPCAKYLTKKYGVNYSTLRERLREGGVIIGKIHYKYEDTN